eukprot:1820954-Karenia_brevis.AAC.1
MIALPIAPGHEEGAKDALGHEEGAKDDAELLVMREELQELKAAKEIFQNFHDFVDKKAALIAHIELQIAAAERRLHEVRPTE